MAYVNFGRKNTREEALASENKDKVFFPTDATSIILGGKEYGVGDVKEEDLFEEESNIPEGYVDLGLPSGTLWATCNLGASTETEYGDYYMWGSTTPNTNDVCDWEHAPFNNGSSSFDRDYFNAHKDEWLDGDVLKPEYDAVYQATGGKAHIPTKEDFDELIANTRGAWTTINEVNGRLFTSKIDSTKKIFIPASGTRSGSSFSSVDAAGLWSSSLVASLPNFSWNLTFYSQGIDMYYDNRFYGFCVRGVCNPTSGGSKKIKSELLEDYATKDELNALDLSIFKMVNALPTDNIDENKIYLVPSTETEEGNIYTEYTYKNNAWEKLGEYKSDVDVTSYYWADQKISASSNAATTPTVRSLRSQYLLANDNLWISKNPTGSAANTVLNNLYFKVNNVAPGSIDSANNLGTASYPWKTLNAIEATIGRANGAYGQNVITKGILKLQNTNDSYTSVSSSATENTDVDLAHFNDVHVKEATLDGYYPLTMVESSGGLPKYEALYTKTNIKYNPVQNILDTGRVHAHTYTYSEHPENASLVVYNSLDSGNQDNIYTSMRPRIGFIYHDNHVDDRYCGQIVMDKAGFTLYRGSSDNSKNTDGSWKGTNDSTYVASNGGTPYAALRCGEIKTFVDGEWKDVIVTSISSEQISTLTF